MQPNLCNNNMMFVIQHEVVSTSPLCGKLHTLAELDSYEEIWHSQIFLPQWNSLKKDVCRQDMCTIL